jgi:hypothetical protein
MILRDDVGPLKLTFRAKDPESSDSLTSPSKKGEANGAEW